MPSEPARELLDRNGEIAHGFFFQTLDKPQSGMNVGDADADLLFVASALLSASGDGGGDAATTPQALRLR